MSDSRDDARVAVLEQVAKDTRDALADMRTDVRAIRADIGGLRTEIKGDNANLDGRLREVEVSNGRLEGKIDALTGTVVGQTSAALAKLPSWWQMPALAAALVALGVAAIAGIEFLQTHGLL